jgi:hypothetical protein
MRQATIEKGLPPIKSLFSRKRRVIDRNRLDFNRRYERASDVAKKIFESARAAIDRAWIEDPLIPRNVVVWSSDDLEPGTVLPGHVVEALLLLRHPAIGYKGLVRRTTVRGPGRPIFRIWYRHNALGL